MPLRSSQLHFLPLTSNLPGLLILQKENTTYIIFRPYFTLCIKPACGTCCDTCKACIGSKFFFQGMALFSDMLLLMEKILSRRSFIWSMHLNFSSAFSLSLFFHMISFFIFFISFFLSACSKKPNGACFFVNIQFLPSILARDFFPNQFLNICKTAHLVLIIMQICEFHISITAGLLHLCKSNTARVCYLLELRSWRATIFAFTGNVKAILVKMLPWDLFIQFSWEFSYQNMPKWLDLCVWKDIWAESGFSE